MTEVVGTAGRPQPKHRTLQRELAALATEAPPGTLLPSERVLMDRHRVSRATVRRAIESLVNEGVLERAQGRGTFVARPRVRSTLHLASFSHDMRRRGHEPSSHVLSLTREPTSGPVAAFFRGAAAWRLERVRLADGEPMALEVDHVNAGIATDLGSRDLSDSLYSLLESAYDSPIDSADQTVCADAADERTAALLGIDPGAPVMVFERLSRSRGRPLEYVTSWYRGDRYALHMGLDESMREQSPGETS